MFDIAAKMPNGKKERRGLKKMEKRHVSPRRPG
jgi:hypothetical protein